jgi:hypothetical protein
MTSETDDSTLHGLRRLTVLTPEPARSERVRRRCRATLGEQRLQEQRSRASRRPGAFVLESGLIYGLSVGYFAAVIGDLLRVYMRR